MEQPKDVPRIKYYLSNNSRRHFHCIVVDEVVIHHTTDMLELYRAVGYTEELQKAHVDPEVFIWSEYHQDHAIKGNVCLQARIVEYLNKTSEAFKAKYSQEYERWAGKCVSKKIRHTTDCIGCRMHPLNGDK